MSHDDFESERFRVERVLEILEHAARRLDARAHVPLTVLKDAVTFIRASEATARDAAQSDDSEPTLTACLEQHEAALTPLATMTSALEELERGQASAASKFARAARAYVDLRREHLRIDDRLFVRAPRRSAVDDPTATPIEAIESVATRKVYDRLIEAAAILDIGIPASAPRARRQLSSR